MAHWCYVNGSVARIEQRLAEIGYRKELDWIENDGQPFRLGTFRGHRHVKQAKDLTDRSVWISRLHLISH